jgi:hypothetical protein
MSNPIIDKAKSFEKYISNDFYLSPKILMLLFVIFSVVFLYIRNNQNIKLYQKYIQEIELIKQNNLQKKNILKTQLKRLASIPTPNNTLFSDDDINSWKKLIQVYSITLSKRLNTKEKPILYVKSIDNKAIQFKNATLLKVYMNDGLVPIQMQTVITLFLSQFGYIKEYSSKEYEVYIIKENK